MLPPRQSCALVGNDELGALLPWATVTGVVFRTRASTLCGTLALVGYLILLIGSLVVRPQVAIGVYFDIGGGVLFAIGIALSIYRERLLALPTHIANRDGLFRILDWR